MKVENYGDMLSKVKRLPCVAYVTFGSYQGEWVAALDTGDFIELWKGYYGSCSGCDFIEGAIDYKTKEIDDYKAQEYFKENRPFIQIPKNLIKDMTLEQFKEIFPANIRNDIYDYDENEMFNAIKDVK